MPVPDGVFSGSIAENYARYMVPLIFEPYAADLARRASARSPHSVLETAAGTGVVPRFLLPLLPDDATYVATDLNQPMLDIAASAVTDPRVRWQQADAQELPFGDASFDLVLCQFGAMFFPDRVGAYREARRVLSSGGAFVFAVWDSLDANDFAAEVTAELAEMFPDDPPRFMARTPHGYHDVSLIEREIADAGFTAVSTDTVTAQSVAPSALVAATAYCQGTPVRLEIEERDADRLQEATERSAARLAARFGDDEVRGRIRAHVVTASG
ncbi:class I SAM-dependent methyltransferase [Streptomyces sp. AC495_CC817]|uniref:class I SAM-dependent methyltransferase n=1 Tax=Streptomyces sp. AC495_CC817 TaxID=2823900 RepID=UPI001C276280|nr:class I SAM-dependent methyltransferase [Streptomyces sp. AC495_CC817]